MSLDAEVEVIKATLSERDRRYGERFDAQERANSLALDAAEKAVLKAEGAAEKRFEAVNEFRATLADQAGSFATRAEMNAEFRAVNAALSRLETKDASNAGRGSGMTQLWGYLVGGAGIIIAVVTIAQNALR